MYKYRIYLHKYLIYKYTYLQIWTFIDISLFLCVYKYVYEYIRIYRNYWVMVSVPLPIAPTTALQRLNKCNETTSEIKKSPTAYVQMFLQELLPHILPKFLQLKTAFDIFSRHTIVFSNVPGPANIISMCGEKVVGMQVLFPNILPTCIILSYAGNVFLNLNIDDDSMPGLDTELPKYFIDELKELCGSYKIDTEHMLADISPGCYFGIPSNK
jgi:hypothetical protein